MCPASRIVTKHVDSPRVSSLSNAAGGIFEPSLCCCFLSPTAVYDLLDFPDCLPNLLQGSLKNDGRDEAFLLSSFRLQSRAPTSLYSIVNPKDGSKYLELSVQAKLSKGVCSRPASIAAFTRASFPSSASLSLSLLLFARCQ